MHSAVFLGNYVAIFLLMFILYFYLLTLTLSVRIVSNILSLKPRLGVCRRAVPFPSIKKSPRKLFRYWTHLVLLILNSLILELIYLSSNSCLILLF